MECIGAWRIFVKQLQTNKMKKFIPQFKVYKLNVTPVLPGSQACFNTIPGYTIIELDLNNNLTK